MSRRLVGPSLVVCLAFLPSVMSAAPPIPGSDAVLKPGARVIFGEMHGTSETPKFVADLAEEAVGLGTLRVCLEIPRDEQPRIDAYLRSRGRTSDREKLLSGPFWTREDQDGRSSVAMAALLESLRVLRRRAKDLRVIAFDLASSDDARTRGDDRDLGMAQRLAAAFDKEPSATFIVLVGNLHARKTRAARYPQTFMAQRLMEMHETIVTLNVRYAAGVTWACIPECGPLKLSGGAERPRDIELGPTADGAYDGMFFIGTPTPAVPAARPLTDAQARRLLELMPAPGKN